MSYDITLHICHCVLPFLSRIWCKEFLSLYLTCKTIHDYINDNYGRIINLPNNVPYILTGDEKYISMTNTYKCVIEYNNNQILIVSYHTRGFVNRTQYNIKDGHLYVYDNYLKPVSKYQLVITREDIPSVYPYCIDEYIPKRIIIDTPIRFYTCIER